jgi:hypothetical protein
MLPKMPAIQMDAQTGRANVTKEEIKAFNAYPDEQDKLFLIYADRSS